MRIFIRFVAAAIDLTLLFICGLVVYYSIFLPNKYYVTENKPLTLCCFFDVTGNNNEKNSPVLFSSKSTDVSVNEQTTLKLFGIIPIKEVDVETVDAPVLVPCGEPFGIKLLSDGVMVVGTGEIQTSDGAISPAVNAGVKIGDIIVSLGGQKVLTNSDIASIISASEGSPVDIELVRGEKKLFLQITPVYSATVGGYQAGMWVRDSTAGIGTLTFYEASSGLFGGLGHPVCDVDTGQVIPLSTGNVCKVTINGVVKGSTGCPGELRGSFSSVSSVGKLTANTNCGVFGRLSSSPSHEMGIPMAMRQEVKTGPATILTTTDGDMPREYTIEIEKIDLRDNQSGKNMVIHITDERLLSETGGIVQGMSGSPIIQDGRLVGAVTHVFVNDSTRGYAVFCENMYSALLTSQESCDKAA